MTVTFPASVDTGMGSCDYCGQYRMLAHIRIASETDTWLLCAPCVKDDHTDEDVKAALAANQARAHATHLAAKAAQEVAAATPHVPPPPEPYSRSYAASVVDRYWVQEELDDRQADRLCAAIWAGQYDQMETFHRALRCGFVRHAARMHKDLGPRDPTRKHRSGLHYFDLLKDADGLRILILTMVQQGQWWQFDWQERDWRRRLCLLKRRYRWLTGQEWAPYTITSKERE